MERTCQKIKRVTNSTMIRSESISVGSKRKPIATGTGDPTGDHVFCAESATRKQWSRLGSLRLLVRTVVAEPSIIKGDGTSDE